MRTIEVVIEKHPDGYVAYLLGFKGVVIGEGDTRQQALADCQSAIRFHVETFGAEEKAQPVFKSCRSDQCPSNQK